MWSSGSEVGGCKWVAAHMAQGESLGKRFMGRGGYHPLSQGGTRQLVPVDSDRVWTPSLLCGLLPSPQGHTPALPLHGRSKPDLGLPCLRLWATWDDQLFVSYDHESRRAERRAPMALGQGHQPAVAAAESEPERLGPHVHRGTSDDHGQPQPEQARRKSGPHLPKVGGVCPCFTDAS